MLHFSFTIVPFSLWKRWIVCFFSPCRKNGDGACSLKSVAHESQRVCNLQGDPAVFAGQSHHLRGELHNSCQVTKASLQPVPFGLDDNRKAKKMCLKPSLKSGDENRCSRELWTVFLIESQHKLHCWLTRSCVAFDELVNLYKSQSLPTKRVHDVPHRC